MHVFDIVIKYLLQNTILGGIITNVAATAAV